MESESMHCSNGATRLKITGHKLSTYTVLNIRVRKRYSLNDCVNTSGLLS